MAAVAVFNSLNAISCSHVQSAINMESQRINQEYEVDCDRYRFSSRQPNSQNIYLQLPQATVPTAPNA